MERERGRERERERARERSEAKGEGGTHGARVLDYLGRAAAATVDVTQSRRRAEISNLFRLRLFPNEGAELDADNMVSAFLSTRVSSLPHWETRTP